MVVIQVYWFKKAYDTNEQEFTKNVHIALKEVAKGILNYNNTTCMPSDPVQQVSSNYFAVMVNDQINAEVLRHYLQSELQRFNIRQGFEFSIYDCANRKMMFGEYSDVNTIDLPGSTNRHPELKRDNYFFTVYFPQKTSAIIWQMSIWLYLSAIVLLVVVFFTYSLFVILRQKRLSEVQRDFINNMAHEIRTPLSSIIVSAQTIKNPDMVQTPQRLLSYTNIILNEAGKLKDQMERVLSIAESENHIKLDTVLLDIHELLKDTAGKQVAQVTGKLVELELNFNAEESQMSGDRLHLVHLFSNLVDNAIKYSKETAHLVISTRNKNKHTIEIRITDHGIGITKEHQKKIFDKFYRVPTGNVHNVKGFGIGLNYVNLVTQMHKGNIKVESEPGKYTTFILTFPVR